MINKIQDWAKRKGIYANSTATTQQTMMFIELGEFADEVLKNGTDHDKAMELGDVIVCLINYLTMIDDTECLYSLQNILDGDYSSDPSFTPDDLVVGFLYADDPPTFIRSMIPLFAVGICTTPSYCLKLAYNKIINRTGEFRNGKFVKSADL